VGEDILQLHKSDILVKGLDKEVTLIALTLSGVTTRPHHTAGLALKTLAVEGIKGLLSVFRGLEVDVGVAERMLILHITAHTNGQDGTALLEGVVDVGLTNILEKVTNVKRTIGIGSRGGRLFR